MLGLPAIMVMGLSVAAFAYAKAGGSLGAIVSCPICHHDSCPLKLDSEKMSAMHHDTDASMADMSDSCPVKNKDGKTVDAAVQVGATATDHKSSCNCPICHKAKEKKDAPAV